MDRQTGKLGTFPYPPSHANSLSSTASLQTQFHIVNLLHFTNQGQEAATKPIVGHNLPLDSILIVQYSFCCASKHSVLHSPHHRFLPRAVARSQSLLPLLTIWTQSPQRSDPKVAQTKCHNRTFISCATVSFQDRHHLRAPSNTTIPTTWLDSRIKQLL